MARKTIQQLEAALAGAEAEAKSYLDQAVAARGRADTSDQCLKESRAHFADLKERLSNSEMENQRLRGYIARVQEDDTVREELLTVGDPTGEQHMVPKRKPTVFEQPNNYSTPRNETSFDHYTDRANRAKPRHWITY